MVKGTQTYVAGARAAQRNNTPHHFNNIDSLFHQGG